LLREGRLARKWATVELATAIRIAVVGDGGLRPPHPKAASPEGELNKSQPVVDFLAPANAQAAPFGEPAFIACSVLVYYFYQ
jgi:hypothetical protein